jgi:glycosyltransferase involved in cell wall biosynthesis
VKILVVTNMAPFIWGGAEELATNLVANLRGIGQQAELLRIPFKWDPYERLLEEMLLCKSMRLINVDRVIAMKFPAYLVPHSRKTMWIPHQYRQAYDLFDSGHSNIPDSPRGGEIRRIIRETDIACFRSAERLFGVSQVIADRMMKYNNIRCEVLMPPLNDPERFVGGEADFYIFAGGRVGGGKRQHLLIEAMRYSKSNIRLIVAGPPDSPAYATRLEDLVTQHQLQTRVVLDLRFLPRETYAQYVNSAYAVAYAPLDEDSVGYVTMEAFQARKPVITVSDSGGLLQIVLDGVTGLVCEPSAEQLGEVIDKLAASASRATQFGMAGHSLWKDMKVTWPDTIDRLLQ